MAELKSERKIQVACELPEGVRAAMLQLCQAYGMSSAEWMRSLIISALNEKKLLDARIYPNLENAHRN